MCESYMFDHLRPLGVLSAYRYDLLVVGHDLEGTPCVCVCVCVCIIIIIIIIIIDHSVFAVLMHK